MSIDIDAIPEEFDPEFFDDIGEQNVRPFSFSNHFNSFY